MTAAARDRQISIRIDGSLGLALEREPELRAMFDAAAEDLTHEDLAERKTLLGGFASGVNRRNPRHFPPKVPGRCTVQSA